MTEKEKKKGEKGKNLTLQRCIYKPGEGGEYETAR